MALLNASQRAKRLLREHKRGDPPPPLPAAESFLECDANGHFYSVKPTEWRGPMRAKWLKDWDSKVLGDRAPSEEDEYKRNRSHVRALLILEFGLVLWLFHVCGCC